MPLTITNTFVAGTNAVAEEVNENFEDVKAKFVETAGVGIASADIASDAAIAQNKINNTVADAVIVAKEIRDATVVEIPTAGSLRAISHNNATVVPGNPNAHDHIVGLDENGRLPSTVLPFDVATGGDLDLQVMTTYKIAAGVKSFVSVAGGTIDTGLTTIVGVSLTAWNISTFNFLHLNITGISNGVISFTTQTGYVTAVSSNVSVVTSAVDSFNVYCIAIGT